ncbi:MAG: RsmB/NOP family class I SAM-dependent RNA methyltransferase [Thermoplasmata archaeon]|nr:MAG: RsmB/NOP family class I SAM-dependent RNA methyltransferase [Thermoplasmata archaeon]
MYTIVFEDRLKKMLPDYEKFFISPEWKSIRVNTLKISKEKLLEKIDFEVKEMPWYEYGLWAKGEISRSLEYYMGYYHIQEAGSMIPPLFLPLREDKKSIVIDACAAPGSKTTQMAMMMENSGVIIANDVNIKRIRALVHNVQKAGAMNVVIAAYDARRLYSMGIEADYILLDAPCTASGKIAKVESIIKKWNYARIKAMARKQKKLIEGAYHALKKGGVMVYSTCSIEPEENEEVIDFAIKNFNLEPEKFKIKNLKTRKGIKEWYGKRYEGAEKCIRIWPQDNQTEGFFICRLRKY